MKNDQKGIRVGSKGFIMRYTDRLLILIILVLVVLGSMFVAHNRRLVRPQIEQETNLPDVEPISH